MQELREAGASAADQRPNSEPLLRVLMADPGLPLGALEEPYGEPEFQYPFVREHKRRKQQHLRMQLEESASVHHCRALTTWPSAGSHSTFISGNHLVTTNHFSNFDPSVQRILLKITDPETHREVHYTIHKCTRLGRLMDTYAESMGLPVSKLRFMVQGGQRICPDETGETYGLESGNVIIAHHIEDD